VSLIDGLIPKLIDAFAFWLKFGNSAMLHIGLSHLQPFTNSHFSFLIIVQSAPSQVLLQQPKLHSTLLC
jgi:hypothetical protein